MSVVAETEESEAEILVGLIMVKSNATVHPQHDKTSRSAGRSKELGSCCSRIAAIPALASSYGIAERRMPHSQVRAADKGDTAAFISSRAHHLYGLCTTGTQFVEDAADFYSLQWITGCVASSLWRVQVGLLQEVSQRRGRPDGIAFKWSCCYTSTALVK